MRSLLSATLLGLLGIVAGCSESDKGPPKVGISGKVVNKGTPLALESKGPPGSSKVELSFWPVGPDGKVPTVANPTFAIVKDDGTFKVDGGIPTGKYKVVIHQWNPFPNNDILKGKFSKEKSSVVEDITGEKTLDLDVSTLK